MIITVPSKTFLVGEYTVFRAGPALLLTTPPCFTYETTTKIFFDPYAGRGGFGASSAKFVLEAKAQGEHDPWEIWQKYRDSGLVGSGADVIAQCCGGLVFFHSTTHQLEKLSWPFADLSFALIHTGQKLATHEHLTSLSLQVNDIDATMTLLSAIVESAHQAIKNQQKPEFLQAIRDYALALNKMNLVAPHTQQLLEKLYAQGDVLACKGCGAMGSDVVLAIISTENQDKFTLWTQQQQLSLIFCGNQCYE